MKKHAVAMLFLAAASTSASAADLPARTYTKAPVVVAEPIYNWTGFYIGANGGYGWGHTDGWSDRREIMIFFSHLRRYRSQNQGWRA